MYLRDLLVEDGYDPASVLALRHGLSGAPKLRELMPRLVEAKPALFNAIQRWQFNKSVEERFKKFDYIAAFLGNREHLQGDAKRAIFAGLYKRLGWEELTAQQVSQHKDALALIKLGATEKDFIPPRAKVLRFQLRPEKHFTEKYKGKLIISWPVPRSWNQVVITPNDPPRFPIFAILPENSFQQIMPDLDELVLSWEELKALPESWKKRLSDWKGIYLITDKSDGKAYVGAAYGKDGILQRWIDYKKTGHGNNTLLIKRDPNNFLFTILARLSPDLEEEEVLDCEESWKTRLHTKNFGLNAN